ncbi:ExbD/TolR family protein [Vibrio tapetis]|uniref:Biopolymer transport protein exbD1 n=1 Tax=Vibrio tapetis subsp. tapetis TaxID=1671868 RepID=A0A2N8ZNA0_9VIBR|nr:biopolymer transporter ExbD [Vibrio tapetis]SON53404.1 Biopolymer transport protein exbD1 [Vibrio tapetis subsp. tapetis]
MIRSSTQSSASDFKPDLTPLLDIIFIVMVFLLLTANINIKTMQLDIPTTDQTQVLSEPVSQVIAINILEKSPHWAIDQTSYKTWADFSAALVEAKNQFPKREVIIGSDKSVPVEKMLQLLAFMQQNKIDATSIMMEEK